MLKPAWPALDHRFPTNQKAVLRRRLLTDDAATSDGKNDGASPRHGADAPDGHIAVRKQPVARCATNQSGCKSRWLSQWSRQHRKQPASDRLAATALNDLLARQLPLE